MFEAGLEDGIAAGDGYPDGVELQCPRCRAFVDVLDCGQCGFRMRISRGIVHALLPERAEHYARFIKDYEGIRAAEGRGSKGDEYYLGLPYEDASGRNREQWHIRARSFDHLMGQVLAPIERGSRVLDIGAGNCWMSFRLAVAGYQPVAVDLLTNEHDGLAAAAHYDKHLPQPLPRFQAEMTRLPFEDEQFDAIVFNASFHYSEDYEATLCEALRCLKIGGQVIISDTPWYSREESGQRMIAERQTAFIQRYGTASDSVTSLEFLTNERLRKLEMRLSIRWTVHSPQYGFKWNMRPVMAKLRGRREPSRFRIYGAKKHE
ncbi:MAG: Methyltransferase type 11 [Edaphobacter sp.]|nr:Methyltransferase type 11 [Edaphobacter sp.]